MNGIKIFKKMFHIFVMQKKGHYNILFDLRMNYLIYLKWSNTIVKGGRRNITRNDKRG